MDYFTKKIIYQAAQHLLMMFCDDWCSAMMHGALANREKCTYFKETSISGFYCSIISDLLIAYLICHEPIRLLCNIPTLVDK